MEAPLLFIDDLVTFKVHEKSKSPVYSTDLLRSKVHS